ncbi:MAG: HD domain-containing protein [bacterium]
MQIKDVYTKYQLMPNLQLHCFRVAAVARLIAINTTETVDEDNIVAAALLHDIGNIAKFDLTLFPEYLEPQGLQYWQRVQDQFIQKYAKDEHIATLKILEELKVGVRITELVAGYGFGNAVERSLDQDLARMIGQYADCRVAPAGVVTMQQRENEGRERYRKNKKIKHISTDDEQFERLFQAMELVEERIFAKSRIKPEEINDKSVEPIISEVQQFNLVVNL